MLERILGLAIRTLHAGLRMLPPRASRALGGALGATYARLGGPRVADARVNLAIAFPEWTAPQRQRVLVESFANLGRSLAEVSMLGGPHDETLHRGVHVTGLEHLEAAQASSPNGGVLIVSAHFGAWELCATGLVRAGVPLSVVHHELDNPEIARIVDEWRARAGLETLALGEAARGIFRALERGRCIGVLMDQNAKLHDGVFAPFFGLDACTRSGPVRVAMRKGVPIITAFIVRAAKTGEHEVRVGPMLEIESAAGDDADEALLRNVARMNVEIEQLIREAPEQWIWSHRRWKTRPPGAEDSPYPPRSSRLRAWRKRLDGRASAR